MGTTERCPICGRALHKFKGISICLSCNDRYGEYYNFFAGAVQEFKSTSGTDLVIIECLGVTIYDETNTRVVLGVRWDDPRDFSKGYTIVGRQVFAPNHQPKRAVPRDKAANICRCQACQDFTIRMRTFNNQKMRDAYAQDSPMMPRYNPGESFNPLNELH